MNQVINTFITGLNNIGRGFWDYAAVTFIQVSLLIILLLILDFLLRKRVRAMFRYCLWMLLVVKLVLPASFTLPTGIGYWMGDYFPSEDSIAKFIPQTKEAEPMAIDVPQWYVLETLATNKTVPAGIELESISWQGLVFSGWVLGMFVLSVLVVRRFYFVRRLIDNSRPANERSLELLDECRSRMGISRDIELRLTGDKFSPAVCGLFKPVILVPAALLTKLSREKLRTVLIHELAHVKRDDAWVNLLQTILQVVYFYNPLLWLANAMVRRAREQAVDEMVLVTLSPETKNYSNMLIDIAEMAFWRPNFSLSIIGVIESKKALERRINHMLTRPVPKKSKLGCLGVIAIVVIGAVLLPMGRNSMAEAADTQENFRKNSETNIIIPGLRVGYYTFNMSKDDILERLGKPKAIFFADKSYTLDNLPEKYFMHYGDVSFGMTGDSIKGITALSPSYKFPNGLGIGDSEKKIKQAFGDNFKIEETEWKDFLSYKDKGLVFEINKQVRTVMEINVVPIPGSEGYKKADIPPTSTINEEGRIVDKIDYPFVNDPRLIGTWNSVDFVGEMEQFKVGEKQWKGRGGELYLKGLIFKPNGKTFKPWWTWTKGLVFHSGDKTAAKYTLKNIEGSTYMFYEWKSGDYTIRHRKPSYYVFKKVSSKTSGSLDKVWISKQEDDEDEEFTRRLPARIRQLDIDMADLERVKEIFGKPLKYIWGRETFSEDNLPKRYILYYPSQFRVFMSDNKIVEIRHESGFNYVFRNKLRFGSTLDEVFEVIGHPEKVVQGEENKFKNGVLYKDIDGREGHCYYGRYDQNARLWFLDYKIIAIYMTRSDYGE